MVIQWDTEKQLLGFHGPKYRIEQDEVFTSVFGSVQRIHDEAGEKLSQVKGCVEMSRLMESFRNRSEFTIDFDDGESKEKTLLFFLDDPNVLVRHPLGRVEKKDLPVDGIFLIKFSDRIILGQFEGDDLNWYNYKDTDLAYDEEGRLVLHLCSTLR